MNPSPGSYEPTLYLSPLRMSGHHGIVLAAQLAVAAPRDLGPNGRKALAAVAREAEVVGIAITHREKQSAGALRPVLGPFDACHAALYGRLTAAARMPASLGDMGASGAILADTIYGSGVAFLLNDAETRFAESGRRLQVITDKGLESEIDRIAGAGYLAGVRRAHAALGEALGAGVTPVRYTRAELKNAVAALAAAIAEYALQLAAETDKQDAESVRRFQAAMMPIDRFRADRAGSGEDEEDALDAQPTTPGTPGTPDASPFITAS
jgi:hypothetical protein